MICPFSSRPLAYCLLLQGAFDKVALRLGVFKVETIGDCYVAVSGLPEPRNDHAVVMAKFARECMDRMKPITNRLEVVLGPDTGDLVSNNSIPHRMVLLLVVVWWICPALLCPCILILQWLPV